MLYIKLLACTYSAELRRRCVTASIVIIITIVIIWASWAPSWQQNFPLPLLLHKLLPPHIKYCILVLDAKPREDFPVYVELCCETEQDDEKWGVTIESQRPEKRHSLHVGHDVHDGTVLRTWVTQQQKVVVTERELNSNEVLQNMTR